MVVVVVVVVEKQVIANSGDWAKEGKQKTKLKTELHENTDRQCPHAGLA